MGNVVSRLPRPGRTLSSGSPETRFPGRQRERGGSRSPPAVPPSRAGHPGKCSPAVLRRQPLPRDPGSAEPAFPSAPRAGSPQVLLGQGAGRRLAAAALRGARAGLGGAVGPRAHPISCPARTHSGRGSRRGTRPARTRGLAAPGLAPRTLGDSGPGREGAEPGVRWGPGTGRRPWCLCQGGLKARERRPGISLSAQSRCDLGWRSFSMTLQRV